MRLRAAVDKAASNREQYVDKFCNNLDRDITELGKEVKEIKNQAQVHVHAQLWSSELFKCVGIFILLHSYEF